MSLFDDVGGVFADLGDLAAPAVLSRSIPGAYDPSSGSNAAGMYQTCPTTAVLDGSSMKTLGSTFGEGLIQGGDITALIPGKGLAFLPAPGDTLTVLDWPYTVIDSKPTYGGSVALTFLLLLRK